MYLSYFIILSLFLKYVKTGESAITNEGPGYVTESETLAENGYFENTVVEDEENDVHTMNIRIITTLEYRISIKDRRRVWLDGIVPYVLSKKYETNEINAILAGMEAFKNETCIRFIPRKKEVVYLLIEPKRGCSASIGKFKKNGASISRGCFQKGIVIHELMHVLGFFHEQNRPDRDDFVTINYDNIQKKHKRNFDKAVDSKVRDGNISYDYNSVMHYGRFTFAKNRSIPTVIPKQKDVQIGQRDGFSEKDIQRINLFYRCKPEAGRRRVKRYASHIPVRRVDYGHIPPISDYYYAPLQNPRQSYQPVAYPDPGYSAQHQRQQSNPGYYDWPSYPEVEQRKILYPPTDPHKLAYPPAQPKIAYPTPDRPPAYPPAQLPKLAYPQASPPSYSYSPSHNRPQYNPVAHHRNDYQRPTYAPVQYPRPVYANEGLYRPPYVPLDYPKPVYTTAVYRRPYYSAYQPPADYPLGPYGSLPDPKPYTDPYYEITTETTPTTFNTNDPVTGPTTAVPTTTTAIPTTTTVIPTTTTALPTTTTTAPTTTTAVPTTTTVLPTTTTAAPTTTTAFPTTTTAAPTTTTAVPTSTTALPTTTTAALTTTAVPTTTTAVPTTTTALPTTTTAVPTTTTALPTTTTAVPTTTTMLPTTTTEVPTTTTEMPTTTTEVPTTTETTTESGGTEEDSTTAPPTSTTVETTTEEIIDEGYMPYYYPYQDYFPASLYSDFTFRRNGDFVDDKAVLSDSYHKMKIFPGIQGRTALRDPSAFWARGIVPYVLSDKYDDQQKGFILEAMQEFHNRTCVRFVPRRNQASYIFVEPNNKCSATIGRVPGRANKVRISEGCYLTGTIIHELMHTLGFVHEQNRPDRDQYVIVMFDNIIPDARKNFRKYTTDEVQTLGESYDYDSVMHYSNVEFAIDPDRPTLVPLQAGVTLGQRDGFSTKDIIKINKLYKCQGFRLQAKEVVTTPAPIEEFKKYFQSNILRLFRGLLRVIQNFKPTKPK